MVDVNTFKAGMRRLVSGVSLITTVDDDRPYGFIATSVSSLTIDPPTLIVCIGHASQSLAHITQSGAFCVTLMSYADKEIAKRFSDADRTNRFLEGEWISHASGNPALRNAPASFDCRVSRAIDHRSHAIVIGEVKGVRLGDDVWQPLLYQEGDYTTSADRMK